MSANIQNYIRPTGDKSRAEINKILEALQDLFAAPIEEEAVHERIALTPHRKKKTQTFLSGDDLTDGLGLEYLDNETFIFNRSISASTSTYPLTHSEVGAITFSVQSTKYGGRGDFNGSSSLAIADHTILDITDEVTLSGFFYLPATESGDVTQFLLGKGVYSLEVQPHIIAGNTIRGNVTIGGTIYDVTSTYTPNIWNHLVLSWKSPNVKLYINGTLADTNTSATGTLDTNSDSFEVGDGTIPSTSAVSTTISSTASSPTNTNPIPVTVTFSDNSLTGFTSSDVVTAGTVQSFTDNNPIFTFNVLASTNGTVTVDVPADVAYQRHGTGNTVATQFSILLDDISPAAPVINVYIPDPTANIILTLTGTGETGSVVTLTSSLDGSVGTATVSGGTWSITTSTLQLGTHSFTAIQTDSASNVSPVSSAESITIEVGYVGLETGESLLLETGDKIILE
jgi:hypothetical protein